MGSNASPFRVFIVDDHPVVREGIRVLLEEAGMSVVGSAATVAESLHAIEGARPNLVLVDLGLGEEEGDTLLRALAKGEGRPRALVYSMNEDAPSIERSLAAGADGYVTKGEVWEILLTALRVVASGQRYLSPLARRVLHAPATAAEPASELSARETEVYRLLGEGYSTKEMANLLDVGPRTIESYCLRLQEKLGLPGMRELRRRAIAARSA